MRVLCVGGGIFGCCIATELAYDGHDVTLAEKQADIMQGASKHNHNRLHVAAHYPRSVVTAKQSIEGLASFLMCFGPAILCNFPNYYAIAKEGSLTTTREFKRFFDEVGVSYQERCPEGNLLNCDKLDSCFMVKEPIFDYEKLKEMVGGRLTKAGVDLRLNCSVDSRSFTNRSWDYIVNTTYTNINELNRALGVKELELLYEDVMIPHFTYPMPPVGLTVMDGSFCTVMPKGFEPNTFLLYHVHRSVLLATDNAFLSAFCRELQITLSELYKASSEYMPFLTYVKHIDQYRTIRAVYENASDARLTEIQIYPEYPKYITVLSGKIGTAVRTALQVRDLIAGKPNAMGALV